MKGIIKIETINTKVVKKTGRTLQTKVEADKLAVHDPMSTLLHFFYIGL